MKRRVHSLNGRYTPSNVTIVRILPPSRPYFSTAPVEIATEHGDDSAQHDRNYAGKAWPSTLAPSRTSAPSPTDPTSNQPSVASGTKSKVLTLDISLNTEVCASLNSATTSCRLLSMASSSPTARVMRAARLLRRLWSMLSSHGEPGARKALYRPASHQYV